jgi:S1-C subfamily serine protease
LKTLLYTILLASASAFGQYTSSKQLCIQIPKVDEWGHSVGRLFADTALKDSIGTAFLVSNTQIMTCAHVLEKDHKTLDSVYFQPIAADTAYMVYLQKIDYGADLALLKTKHFKFQNNLRLSRTFNLSPRDTVYYIGYSTLVNGCCLHKSVIMMSGKMLNYSSIIEFVQFVGEGIPGYSGGPLFNNYGEIVGIVAQGIYWRGVKAKPSESILRNNAFSIVPFLKYIMIPLPYHRSG